METHPEHCIVRLVSFTGKTLFFSERNTFNCFFPGKNRNQENSIKTSCSLYPQFWGTCSGAVSQLLDCFVFEFLLFWSNLIRMVMCLDNLPNESFFMCVPIYSLLLVPWGSMHCRSQEIGVSPCVIPGRAPGM